MAEPSTFFKIDRVIFGNELWLEKPFDRLHAWIYIIGNANYKDTARIYRGQRQVIKRGQLPTSDRKLAEDWGWSRDKVRRFLRMLERSGMCTVTRSTNNTTITVVNYDKFQDGQSTNKTTDDTTDNTTDKTTDNTTDDTHKKNSKESKEGEERKESVFSTSPPGRSYEPTPPDVLARLAECIGGMKI